METHFPSYPLAELHAHLSTSIHSSVYWQIAQSQGFKLPKRDYHEFIKHITLSQTRTMELNTYFSEIYHPLLDKLSSGTYAVEKATYEIMSGAYRNNITLLELRNNPMKHNQGGAVDLDHVIMAMLRGMERALLEYNKLSAGIIFCLAREFTYEQNEIIVEKAVKYHRRGVVGIDIAGPGTPTFHSKDYQSLMKRAKQAGLQITVHSGETKDADDMWDVLEFLEPQRIGHGIRAAYDKALMQEIVKRGVILEVCPLSNLVTKAVENIDEIKFILKTFKENKVKFCINTDWPEIIEDGHLWRQFKLLRDENILTEEDLKHCNQTALESTFVPPGGLSAYL
ncbi:MAG: adenosine deaminase [Candidatus Levybacteria bacterium]|nr:adenosine deaminase [Candidatus Levybacteria bacterium]